MVKLSMRVEVRVLHKEMRRRQFERVVTRAIQSLHPDLRSKLENVQVVVEQEPVCGDSESGCGELFGLYEGTPLTERCSGYQMALPDKITIYQGPLERTFPDPVEQYQQIRITVVHEIAHHFGLDEWRLAEIGYG